MNKSVGTVAQRLFQLMSKSVPKASENIYVEDFEGENMKRFEKLDESFLQQYELYMRTVQKQDEYLLLYRVGIKRDDTEWMENIANKVGLTLPKKNTTAATAIINTSTKNNNKNN